MRKHIIALILIFGSTFSADAQSQKIEVAPGVSVTHRTYQVPINEAPFFNFSEKNEAQRKADQKLIENVLREIPERSKAADAAIAAGTRVLLGENDVSTAAKRFNQAYLFDPQQSGVYHGFAMVVASRFQDFEYADELFRIAARMKSPSRALSADHGRMFLIAGHPAEARPLLEQAVKDTPDWAVPRMNLAWAVLLTGNRDEACRLKEQVKGKDIDKVESDLALFKQKANC